MPVDPFYVGGTAAAPYDPRTVVGNAAGNNNVATGSAGAGNILPGGYTPTSATASTNTSTGNTNTVGTVTPNLPDWIPHSADSFTGELQDQYGKVDNAFNTRAVDAASRAQQAQDLTSGLRAANSAATEYTARVTQQGGSGSASGLIRAEGQVKAMDTAGAAKVEAAKYDVAQREAAAGQSAQIASTLAGLRSSYLTSLAGVATGRTTTGTQTDVNTSNSLTESGKPPDPNALAGSPSGSGGSYVQNLGGGVISASAGKAFYGG